MKQERWVCNKREQSSLAPIPEQDHHVAHAVKGAKQDHHVAHTVKGAEQDHHVAQEV